MNRESSRRKGGITDNEYFVLTALIPSPLHGYGVIKEIEARTQGEVKLGITSLYTALHRLQTAGLIDQIGEGIVDGRARKTYQITSLGEEAIARKERAINQMQTAKRRLASRPNEAQA